MSNAAPKPTLGPSAGWSSDLDLGLGAGAILWPPLNTHKAVGIPKKTRNHAQKKRKHWRNVLGISLGIPLGEQFRSAPVALRFLAFNSLGPPNLSPQKTLIFLAVFVTRYELQLV